MSIRTIITITTIATIFTACSDTETVSPIIPSGGLAISFSAEAPSTRAFGGSINGITNLGEAGFGVYAYYTENNDYTSDLYPDLFFNQSVIWQTNSSDSVSQWTYAPIKYWPNRTGHKASFFAYAPYQSIDLSKATLDGDIFETTDSAGIVSLSANNHHGDPIVGYRIETDSAQAAVDLMWGTGSLLNLSRQDSVGSVNFHFQHALARLGFTISIPGITASIDTASGTIVLVDSVIIKGNFPIAGSLNLNNTTSTTPIWSDIQYEDGDSTSTIIIDHRSITRSLRDVDYDDVKGTDLWLHDLEQGGVNAVSRYLLKAFRGDDDTQGASNRAYFMLIPDGKQLNLSITVSYTAHTFNITGDTTAKHTVSTTQILNALEAGQTYTLHLALPSL